MSRYQPELALTPRAGSLTLSSLAHYVYHVLDAEPRRGGYYVDHDVGMDALDPWDPTPPYQQIASILRGQIESGHYRPGDPLPSEKTLEQTYGVARETARRAMGALRETGHALTIPGRGSYVPPDYTTG